MVWKKENKEGSEALKIRWELVPYTRGKGLDLGAGMTKPFPHFISIDNGHHEMFGQIIRPDIRCDATDLSLFSHSSMDFVFSSHLLEHIQDPVSALREWWRVVKLGGYLILYLPHKDFYPHMGTPGANPDHKHDFVPEDIINIFKGWRGWDLVVNENRNEDEEYSFFQVYKKVKSDRWHQSWQNPKPTKTAAVIRYGAFGDLMQASSVFAGLKEQGFHVTLFTSPPGCDVIMEDPNIDEIIIQDKEQVPNEALGAFWKHLAPKYDRFVNLSESVEGTFLAMENRTNHEWPQWVRHLRLNVNYLEHQHSLAGISVDSKPRVRFYATEEEKRWAHKVRSKLGAQVILWSLAGSAVHKTWPYLDHILASIMVAWPDVEVVLVGGPECRMLEAGWENEPRVHKKSGVWTIRQSLTFIDEADLVVGPETGVLNAAACRPVAKIITLSHSSPVNLTRDWVNTVSLTPDTPTPCWPCHMLHTSWRHCVKDEESGTALCQKNISIESMWQAIQTVIWGIRDREVAA
jgi:ADP-heptose:LPS heptosyltransferase/predicted SAM-dependent methyltransferase